MSPESRLNYYRSKFGKDELIPSHKASVHFLNLYSRIFSVVCLRLNYKCPRYCSGVFRLISTVCGQGINFNGHFLIRRWLITQIFCLFHRARNIKDNIGFDVLGCDSLHNLISIMNEFCNLSYCTENRLPRGMPGSE